MRLLRIRALQLSDLRARRLSGRHQISADGRHLIDGVPFGKPFLKRPVSSRPAITIPPRKKRRTSLASWANDEDAEWAPRLRSLKELSALREGSESDDQLDDDEYEDFHQAQEDTGDGTVIRYNVEQDEDAQASESDADISDFDDGDLTEELKDLKEDIQTSEVPQIDRKADDEQPDRAGYPLRTRSSLHRAPRPSILHNAGKKFPDADVSRRDSKAVRFEGQEPPHPAQKSPEPEEDTTAVEKASSSSSSSSDESSDTDSDEEGSSSLSDSSDSESNSSSSSSDSDDSASESELEDVSTLSASRSNPPGLGSQRTKKSNLRHKLRRRLAKLKELGALPPEADFAALRDLEEKHGGSYKFPPTTPSTKESEQAEFEAKRQKLLRDLESGGIDVTEKENVPPGGEKENNTQDPVSEKENVAPAAENASVASAESKRRTLDVASSRRLLFGSLGVRTPRTKEDEEATRKKLAGQVKINNIQPRQSVTEAPAEEVENDSEENWQEKLRIRATECWYDDIELTAPPFPFEQRWDAEAGDLIRELKGWGKKRKRKQRIQVYDGENEEEEYYGNGDNWYQDEDNHQLNYDDGEELKHEVEGVEQTEQEDAQNLSDETEDDLPQLPDDPASLGDLVEGDLQKGSVIAFMQLDMSKATNWQPIVSEYRVAKLHDVYEDQVLKIRLAKRDRRQPKVMDEDEDEDEDRPQYSGFEMPGFDDDEVEDDGFREMSFADLIEPKLLRAGSVTGGRGDAEKASLSVY